MKRNRAAIAAPVIVYKDRLERIGTDYNLFSGQEDAVHE